MGKDVAGNGCSVISGTVKKIPWMTEENHEQLDQNSLTGLDSNGAPPEYKLEALLLESTCLTKLTLKYS
jgi:hypothetical protein